MFRTRQERARHHRRRVIAKRLATVRATRWSSAYYERNPGRLSKDHLRNCSCWLCKGPRYDRNDMERRLRSDITAQLG